MLCSRSTHLGSHLKAPFQVQSTSLTTTAMAIDRAICGRERGEGGGGFGGAPAGGRERPHPSASCCASSRAPPGGGRASLGGLHPAALPPHCPRTAWRPHGCRQAACEAPRAGAPAALEVAAPAAAHLQQRQQGGEEAVAARGGAERHAGGRPGGLGVQGPRTGGRHARARVCGLLAARGRGVIAGGGRGGGNWAEEGGCRHTTCWAAAFLGHVAPLQAARPAGPRIPIPTPCRVLVGA